MAKMKAFNGQLSYINNYINNAFINYYLSNK